jgi:predicted  nucleic acid-binding Zn-ribbon protein
MSWKGTVPKDLPPLHKCSECGTTWCVGARSMLCIQCLERQNTVVKAKIEKLEKKGK